MAIKMECDRCGKTEVLEDRKTSVSVHPCKFLKRVGGDDYVQGETLFSGHFCERCIHYLVRELSAKEDKVSP